MGVSLWAKGKIATRSKALGTLLANEELARVRHSLFYTMSVLSICASQFTLARVATDWTPIKIPVSRFKM